MGGSVSVSSVVDELHALDPPKRAEAFDKLYFQVSYTCYVNNSGKLRGNSTKNSGYIARNWKISALWTQRRSLSSFRCRIQRD